MTEATQNNPWWRRRLVTPVLAQLRQGATPEKLALTIALGFILGVFPILGSATLLCALAAWALGLNQPVIQLVNYVAYPAQLGLLIPIYRAGSDLFGIPHIPLSISLILERFSADFWKFIAEFGMVAVRGIVVWAIAAPLVAGAIYFVTKPILSRAARRLS
jgi:uncharacterized protein (DUF2062 family)